MKIALVLHPTRTGAADLAGLVAATALNLGFEVTVDSEKRTLHTADATQIPLELTPDRKSVV